MPGKIGEIQEICPRRCKDAKDGLKKIGMSVSCHCPKHDKDDAGREIPGSHIPDGLALPLFVHHIQNVGAGEKTHGEEKAEQKRRGEEGGAYDQAVWGKRQHSAFFIREKEAEDLPDTQGEQRSQDDPGQCWERHRGEQFAKELPGKGNASLCPVP